jgi:HEAT repeat protein
MTEHIDTQIDKLIDELGGPSPVRAVMALVNIGAPALEPLFLALEDQDPKMRTNAAWALGLIGDTRALDPLTMALQDEDFIVGVYAAGALSKIGH